MEGSSITRVRPEGREGEVSTLPAGTSHLTLHTNSLDAGTHHTFLGEKYWHDLIHEETFGGSY